jgi:hypothetical protein
MYESATSSQSLSDLSEVGVVGAELIVGHGLLANLSVAGIALISRESKLFRGMGLTLMGVCGALCTMANGRGFEGGCESVENL